MSNYLKVDPREVHNLCKGGKPSYKDNEKAFILKQSPELDVAAGDFFVVNFCLDNRGSSKGSHYKRYSDREMFEKLVEKLSGSVEIDIVSIEVADIDSMIDKENGTNKRFSISNSFQVIGTVKKVKDVRKLNELVKLGIGSRKSYGYGLIVFMDSDFNLK